MIPRVLVSQIPQPLSSQNLSLAILHRSSVAVGLTARITTSTGIYTQLFTTVNTRTTQTLIVPVAELPTSITIFALTTTVNHGEIFIEMQLRVANTIIAALCSQYLSASLPVYWPPGERQIAEQFPGVLLTTIMANPAAGADATFTVPARARMKLLSLRIALTTVGANTPLVQFTISTSTDTLMDIPSPLTQPAATTRFYSFIANSPRNDAAFSPTGLIVLAIPLIELPADSIITLSGQDADDNWDPGVIYTESLIQASL